MTYSIIKFHVILIAFLIIYIIISDCHFKWNIKKNYVLYIVIEQIEYGFLIGF